MEDPERSALNQYPNLISHQLALFIPSAPANGLFFSSSNRPTSF